MIKIGTPLTLELLKEESEQKFRCKVVEQEESVLYVDYPINTVTGRTEIFSIGTKFRASFVGKDNSVYRFHTEIIKKKNIKILTLLLHYPDQELERIQRREYVRVFATLDVAVHSSDEAFKPFTTITHDLSGGGVSLAIPTGYEIEQGVLIDLWMVLQMDFDEYEYIYAKAKTIRVNHKEFSKNNLLSVKFVEIEDSARDSIIRYCLEKQLRARRKEST